MKKGIAIALGVATVTGFALAYMYKRIVDELETGMNMSSEDFESENLEYSADEETVINEGYI